MNKDDAGRRGHGVIRGEHTGTFLQIFLAVCSLVFPLSTEGQTIPTAEFRQWAVHHVHPIKSVDMDYAHDSDLKPLGEIVGNARVIAFGEPFHDGHEPLSLRNRMIRYGVLHLGFSAVALETCLSSSKVLYDYVLGRNDETDSALRDAFCYGFGDYPENLELLHWLRNYNSARPPEQKVRLYGIDLSGQYFPTAYHSLEAVLSYLDRADPALGKETRSQIADLIPIFRADRYTKLSPPEKNTVTGKIQDLIAVLERERGPLSDATSADDFDWALRQAISAEQDDAFLRSLPPEFNPDLPHWWEAFKPDKKWDHNAEMREVAMADNLLWVEQRECRRGRVFFFAHDEHIFADVGTLGSPGNPPAGQYRQIRTAGSYLRAALGPDLVAVGTYFGHAEGFSKIDSPKAEVHRMEDLLGSVSTPRFVINLHVLPSTGSLHDWFQTPRPTRASIGREADYTVTPLKAYDAIVYIENITPSQSAKKP